MLDWHTGQYTSAWCSGFDQLSPASLLVENARCCGPRYWRMLNRSEPSASSTASHSFMAGSVTPPRFQDAPWSSLKKTSDRPFLSQSLQPLLSPQSQGITSRPLLSWTACPGPVAYQPQSGFLTCSVISTGWAQERPSSLLLVISTRSLSRQNGSQIVPVVRSTTGQG